MPGSCRSTGPPWRANASEDRAAQMESSTTRQPTRNTRQPTREGRAALSVSPAVACSSASMPAHPFAHREWYHYSTSTPVCNWSLSGISGNKKPEQSVRTIRAFVPQLRQANLFSAKFPQYTGDRVGRQYAFESYAHPLCLWKAGNPSLRIRRDRTVQRLLLYMSFLML